MDWSVMSGRYSDLFQGLWTTLLLCTASALLGLTIGLVVTAIWLYGPRLARWAMDLYTWICLGLPLLVVIYLLFFVLPLHGITLEPRTVGVVALAVYYGPYFAQVTHAAIVALPKGQIEAGVASGFTPTHIALRIVMPQALPIMLPPLSGLVIGLIKDSALLAIVSVPEFMFQARQAVAETYAPLEVYSLVALVYWLCSFTCATLSAFLGKRLTRHERHA